MSGDDATTRRFLSDLHVDNVAQQMHIARAATAVGYGLDPCNYTRPFPGSSTQIIQAPPVVRSALSTAAAAAALLGGGGAIAAAVAAVGLWWSGRSAEPPPPPTPPPAEAASRADAEAGARVRIFWGDREITPDANAIEGGAGQVEIPDRS